MCPSSRDNIPIRAFLSVPYTWNIINSFPLYVYSNRVEYSTMQSQISIQSFSTASSSLCLVVKTIVNCFIICIVNVSFLSCPRVRVYARPHVGEKKFSEFLQGQRLMSFSFGNSTAVLLYRSTHTRSWVSIKQSMHAII